MCSLQVANGTRLVRSDGAESDSRPWMIQEADLNIGAKLSAALFMWVNRAQIVDTPMPATRTTRNFTCSEP